MKRIVLWFMSTLTVVTLLFGYHTSTSSEPVTSVLAAPAGGGPSVSTRWGPVRVQVTVTNGAITGVTVVDYPTGNGKDRAINARAVPILVQETLDAQSADIDMISGATVTSEGYLESLQAALDQAGL